MTDKNLKKLFLENYHINNKAKFLPFAGYNMPINYSNGIISEHLNTRNNCGLFDVSHMLQVEIISNLNVIKKLERIIPSNLSDLSIGKSLYSFILNKNGGIIDDLIISKLINKNGEEFFYIVLNASRREIDLKILSETLEDKNYIYERINYNLISLQGPKSRKIINNVFKGTNELKFMDLDQLNYDDYNNIISCSGYTGEDGFEISIHKDITNKIIEKITSFKDVNLCGLGSRDTLRLEAGLCLYGNELNENINPKQANLMWTIPNLRRQKNDFYGSENIINNTYKKNDKIRVGIESISKSIPRSNFKIFNEQNSLIGEVTSGSFSPSLKKPIAMAYIEYEFSEVGNEVYIESRGTKEKGIITKLPFVSHNYKK